MTAVSREASSRLWKRGGVKKTRVWSNLAPLHGKIRTGCRGKTGKYDSSRERVNRETKKNKTDRLIKKKI